ncbi:MAG TPA: hypothetical protein VF384_10325 [Planctomycetota bacterium]
MRRDRRLCSCRLVLLATLPGCIQVLPITRELWSEKHERYLVESKATTQCEVQLESAGAQARRGLWATETRNGPSGRRWWLRPGPEAGEVEALLGRTDWFSIEAVAMEAGRLHAGEDLWRSDVRVRLSGRVDFAAVGREMQMEDLPAVTRQALQQQHQRDGFAYSLVDRPDWPALLRECAQRTRSLDLAPLLGQGAAPVVVAAEFVDDDLRPIAALAEPEGSPVLAERLQQLASARLLVEVCSQDGRHLLCVQPDLVWLWSCLETASGGAVSHCSCWTLEPDWAAPEVAPVIARWHGTMRREDVMTELQSPWPVARVLVTPLALVADAVVFAGEAVVMLLLHGKWWPQGAHRDPATGSR